MYTVEQLRENLEKENISITTEEVSSLLKGWRIDPVYEDEDKVEYFDELAIQKLRKGITLKNEGKPSEEILSIVHDGIINPINAPAVKPASVQLGGEIKRITVDITTQTLALLAESIAQKISDNITTKVKEADIFKPVLNTGKLTRDNEILSKQVEKLLEENKKLISRVNFLQQENTKFKHLFGAIYMKQD